ncbi:transposase [Niallia sp. 03133]|uniref:transposase n=1 Tax=Niallia sp. 03133 TaxID=3458060 RepID=UPI004043F118
MLLLDYYTNLISKISDHQTSVRTIFYFPNTKKNPFYFYALRLRSDFQAVRNSFLYLYSNGLIEGQINRLKTIKRMTYGRSGLKTLEKRVLKNNSFYLLPFSTILGEILRFLLS